MHRVLLYSKHRFLPMSTSLKQKTISGVIWSSLQRFGTMGISFISNIVLARLLTPDDYGCIGMLMIFIALSNTFIDGGFGSALIQKKRPTQEDYSTIFYWNIFLGIILYGVLYLCSPLIADFYNIPLLSKVLRVQGVVLIVNAFGIIQANQLRKQLKFKSIAQVSLTASIVSVIVAIAMAYMGCGVWSLVAQQIAMPLVSTLLYWANSSWRPSWVFSWNSFRELFGFGSFILLSSLLNTFCNNLTGLLIGKFFNSSSMGYFTQAKKLEDVFSTSIEAVVLQVTYPVLVEVKDNFERLRGALRQFNTLLLFVIAPLMLLLNLLATPVITLLLGKQWLPAVPYLKVLAFQGIAFGLQGVNSNAIASIGHSKVLFDATIIKRVVQVFLLLLGMYYGGIMGLLWGTTLFSYFAAFYNSALVHKYIGYRLLGQLKDLLPIIVLNAVSYVLAYSLHFIVEEDSILLYSLMIMVYIASYVWLSLLFKINAITHIREVVDRLTIRNN